VTAGRNSRIRGAASARRGQAIVGYVPIAAPYAAFTKLAAWMTELRPRHLRYAGLGPASSGNRR
jgi:hypothetical protein